MNGTATADRIDRVRNLLACFLLSSFVAALVVFTFKNMPIANKEILVYMVGQLSGMATTVLAFYFTKGAGQDQLDAQKSENTGKMADAVVAAATGKQSDAPVGTPDDPVAVKEVDPNAYTDKDIHSR